MNKIKFENFTDKYDSFGDFADACFSKQLLRGAFYITGTIYENYKLYIEDMHDHHVIIYYNVFDPVYKVIIQKKILLGISEDATLSDLELSKTIKRFESRNLHSYKSRNLEVVYIEDNIYINK